MIRGQIEAPVLGAERQRPQMKHKYTIVENDTRRYPLGATPTADGMHFSFVHPGKECRVILYEQGRRRPAARIPFPLENKTGDVWNVTIKGDFQGIGYLFEADGKEVPDPCARACSGKERWGDLARLLRHRADAERNLPGNTGEDSLFEGAWNYHGGDPAGGRI